MYLQSNVFKGINSISSEINNIPGSIVELPGDRIYSNEPVTVKYVIFPNGNIQKLNMTLSSDPLSVQPLLGGYNWAILVTDQGQTYNISNIQEPASGGQALLPGLPAGSFLGGYLIQYGGSNHYYIPGQYGVGSEIPSFFQGYVSSVFSNFNPEMNQGFSFIDPVHYLYGSLYNVSVLFPLYGSAVSLDLTMPLAKVQENNGVLSTLYCSNMAIVGTTELGYSTLPVSLVITSPQGEESIWIKYQSYSQYSYSISSLGYACPLNLMNNPNVGYYEVRVNGITGLAQAQAYHQNMNLTIQDTNNGLEFVVNGEPLIFNSVTGNNVNLQDTPYIPAHLLNGQAILNLPAGTDATEYFCPYTNRGPNPSSYQVTGTPNVLLASLKVLNSTPIEIPKGNITQIGAGGITLINTGISCYYTAGDLYFYQVNVTLDSTYPQVVYMGGPVEFNGFTGNQYYIGSWSPTFYDSAQQELVPVYPGVHHYVFYFGVTYSFVVLGGHLAIPSLNYGQDYSATLSLSNGATLTLNLNAYKS
ncbi:hypothetical protein [Metallosphaera hakonensis]|uniref:hypothetical protein n=1 Tax=Metallosphaera hakonensis TaxID=79601 RepID=UPI001F0E8868|nr:hypothetical protein [Metallosphaera hakonensis]